MNADILLESFEILAEAPGGIDRLRELILKKAVSGKLSEQFPDDGDAGELVPKYVANQKQMTEHGVIGTQRFQRGSNSPHLPYHIPKNWRWQYLGDVGAIIGGGTPSSSVSSYWSDHESVPWLTPADMRNLSSRYVTRGRRDITPKGLAESSAQLLPRGAVLFSSRAPIGHVAIAAQPLATNQGFKSCVPYIAEMNEYIYLFLLQIGPQVDANATGTTFKEVSGKQVAQIPIPVPPLAEQGRIVKKVHELMALCDQLEERKTQRDNLRDAARKSAINAISTATTPEELETASKRINDNWDVIAGAPEDVDSMRAMILNLAVHGRFSNLSGSLANGEADFIDLGSLMTLEYGKPLDKTLRNLKGHIPVYGANGVKAMTGQPLVKERGIVVGRKGSAGEVNITDGPFWPLDVTFFAKFDRNAFDIYYLFYLLKALDLPRLARGIKPGINRNDVNKLKVLSVNLEEQKLIVSKIDELMALCDQLETSLTLRGQMAEKFTRSVTHAA